MAEAGALELENLVVRLTGDQEQLKATIDSAMESVRGFAEKATGALEAFGAFEFLKKAFEQFQEQEGVTIRLKAAIEANGEAVESTFEKYEQFAKEMKELTATGKDTTLGLLQQAES